MSENGNGSIIQLNNVKKSFPIGDGEVTILKGISFDVKQGEKGRREISDGRKTSATSAAWKTQLLRQAAGNC